MWISILNLISKKIPLGFWLFLGVLILWISSDFWFYGKGKSKIQDAWDISVEEQKIFADVTSTVQEQINTKIDTQVKERVVTIKEKGDVIVKQIPIFIPHPNDSLPPGFRLLHDSAALSKIPNSSSITTTLPTSIGDATRTISNNYTTCNVWREQVIGWQTWYQEQSKIFSQPSH